MPPESWRGHLVCGVETRLDAFCAPRTLRRDESRRRRHKCPRHDCLRAFILMVLIMKTHGMFLKSNNASNWSPFFRLMRISSCGPQTQR